MIKSPVIKAITATVSALMIFSAVSVSANAASIDNNSKTLSKFQIKTSDNTKNDIPSAYSSVELGIVNSPKSQKYNDCWIYSSLSVLETKLLKKDFTANNFSAEHMNLWATTKATVKAGSAMSLPTAMHLPHSDI